MRHQRYIRGTQVEELMIAGLTRQQIADQMGIKIGTVDTHLHKLYKRRGVHNRSQLIAAANDPARRLEREANAALNDPIPSAMSRSA